MLRVLDNFYEDTRPRLLLFPTETVAENFYRELATKPNKYRDWLVDQHKKGNIPSWPELDEDENITPDAMVRLEDERQEYVRIARKLLATWPENVGRTVGTKLAGPLRTFSYEQGGNNTLATDALTRWPRGTDRGSKGGDEKLQIMDRMIILCDEAHNLLWPQEGKKKDIDLCRRRLYNAANSLIVFMTATPVLSGKTAVQDAKRMLELVKGAHFAARNNEGFVSWYMERPSSLFGRLKTPTRHWQQTRTRLSPLRHHLIHNQNRPTYMQCASIRTRHGIFGGIMWQHGSQRRVSMKNIHQNRTRGKNTKLITEM